MTKEDIKKVVTAFFKKEVCIVTPDLKYDILWGDTGIYYKGECIVRGGGWFDRDSRSVRIRFYTHTECENDYDNKLIIEMINQCIFPYRIIKRYDYLFVNGKYILSKEGSTLLPLPPLTAEQLKERQLGDVNPEVAAPKKTEQVALVPPSYEEDDDF